MSTCIPPLSEDLRNINDRTIKWCRNQISEFVGHPIDELPEYGINHDILVGSYMCGFIQGQLLKSNALSEWSNCDEALQALGWLTMSTACLCAIIGPMRMLHVQANLPQMSEAQPTDNIMKLDQAGGSDGIDFAEGVQPRGGGWLLLYLRKNVKLEEMENIAEQHDLAAIRANPISNWIYENRKVFPLVLGVLIGFVLLGGS
jgi:hypothetical protein